MEVEWISHTVLPPMQVDSSGLLGMALAFRAAAGKLTMPEESGDQEQVKPWDAIEVDDSMDEAQRKEALLKQVRLLENEIKKVKSATSTRLNLAKEAEQVRVRLDEEIYNEEKVARMNPFKKKKKVVGSASKSTENSPEGTKSEQGKDEDDEAMKEADGRGEPQEAEETMIDLGPSHVADTPPKRESVGTTVSAMETDED